METTSPETSTQGGSILTTIIQIGFLGLIVYLFKDYIISFFKENKPKGQETTPTETTQTKPNQSALIDPLIAAVWGAKSNYTLIIQKNLNENCLSYNKRILEDGVLGPQTFSALQSIATDNQTKTIVQAIGSTGKISKIQYEWLAKLCKKN